MRILWIVLILPALAGAQYIESGTLCRAYMRNGKITRVMIYRDAVEVNGQIQAKSTVTTAIGRAQFTEAVRMIGAPVDTSKSMNYTLAAFKGKNVSASKPGEVSMDYTAKQLTRETLRTLCKNGYTLMEKQAIPIGRKL